MLYIAWMVILGDHNIIKTSFENFIIGGNSHFVSLARVVTGPRQCQRLQKTSFCILVGIYCHNIPTHTPQSGYHRVNEVAKTANIPQMAEKCINCIKRSSHSAPYKPHGVGTQKHFFGSKLKKKTKRFMIFDPKKGGLIFSTFLTPPPPPPPSKPPKSGFQVGGVWGGPDQKLIGGCVYWTK